MEHMRDLLLRLTSIWMRKSLVHLALFNVPGGVEAFEARRARIRGVHTGAQIVLQTTTGHSFQHDVKRATYIYIPVGFEEVFRRDHCGSLRRYETYVNLDDLFLKILKNITGR